MKNKWLTRTFIFSFILLAGAYTALQLWLNNQAKLAVDDVLSQLTPYARIDYQSVSTNVWTGMVYVKNVRIRPVHNAALAISIQKLGIQAASTKQGLLTQLKLNIQHMTLPVEFADIYPLARQIMSYYPNRYLNGDFFLDYQFNPARYQMRMILFTHIEQLGKLEVKLLSQPYHPQFINAADFANLPLVKLDIRYHDQSLAAKLWSVLGARQGKTAATYQQEVLQHLDSRLQNITDPSIQASLVALKQFVERPTYLHINLTSIAPISLHQLNALPPNMATTSGVNVRIISSKKEE